MASFKELSFSRPLQTNPRHHSHSISLGAVNSNHRVTRRKSVTTTAAASNAAAAMAANMKDTGGESASIPAASHYRRGASGRKGLESSSLGATSGFASYLSRSMNSPPRDSRFARKVSPNSSNGVAADGTDPVPKAVSTKARNRRASEGSHLAKGEGKRALAELRCDRCGKGYKHGSCLNKHMWEHDPAWAITSKLLISKHQQVQLLEAASVLVHMNQDGVPADGPEVESEFSSASPDASSELRNGLSSVETTPPPLEDQENGTSANMGKRVSVGNASAFSRSYQSVPSSSFTGSAPMHSPVFSHFRHPSIDTRPSTAETKLHDDDEADLAAAIGLCNFGTPRTGPVSVSPSVPPVPPLPSRFLDQSGSGDQSYSLEQLRAGESETGFANSARSSLLPMRCDPSLSYKVSDERGTRMGDADRASRQNRNADVDFSGRAAPVDEDDDVDGVFGRMEE